MEIVEQPGLIVPAFEQNKPPKLDPNRTFDTPSTPAKFDQTFEEREAAKYGLSLWEYQKRINEETERQRADRLAAQKKAEDEQALIEQRAYDKNEKYLDRQYQEKLDAADRERADAKQAHLEAREDSQMQRLRADLEAAGINPNLFLGGGGSGGGSPSTPAPATKSTNASSGPSSARKQSTAPPGAKPDTPDDIFGNAMIGLVALAKLAALFI